MKVNVRLKAAALLLIDLAIIAMEMDTLGREWRTSGERILRFYTQNSNIWALFACTVCAVADAVCLIRGGEIPNWVRVARYVFTCCLMVTMIVAMAVLVPSGTSGSFRSFMLKGTLLYLHTLCPLAMLLGWLLHPGKPLSAKHALLAILPTVIYGTIMLVRNARRTMVGPYFFFEVYRQPVTMTILWMIVILGGNFLVALLLGKIHHLTKLFRLKKEESL